MSGIYFYHSCTSCHRTEIVNKDGYCKDCQECIDWFFSKEKNIIKKEVLSFWQVLFFFIFMLMSVTLLGLGVSLFLEGISGLF